MVLTSAPWDEMACALFTKNALLKLPNSVLFRFAERLPFTWIELPDNQRELRIIP